MSKSYSLIKIFKDSEFNHIYAIADKAGSLKEAKEQLHTYFVTLDSLKERGFSAKDMAFHVSQLLAKLYDEDNE